MLYLMIRFAYESLLTLQQQQLVHLTVFHTTEQSPENGNPGYDWQRIFSPRKLAPFPLFYDCFLAVHCVRQ